MAQKNLLPSPGSNACSLSELAAVRRQLDEIERNAKNNNVGNIDLDKIKKQIHVLQNETEEMSTATEQKQLKALEHLQYVIKRKKEIDEVMKALNDVESVDVCFMMDCTTSMEEYIEEMKERIFETIKLLKSRFPNLNIRLAFVGYRDLNLPKDEQFSILDFTNEKVFYSFVSMVECDGGGDVCEDVLGGLEKTIQLNWKQSLRILIHIGDCPSHGQLYHYLSEEEDDLLSYDANGLIGSRYIQELIELKVKYFFGRLTPFTDKMIEQFRKFAKKRMTIEQTDLKNCTTLLPFIVETISQSISSTQSSLLKQTLINDEDLSSTNHTLETDCYRDVIFDVEEPIWLNMRPKKVQVIKYECNDQLQCKMVDQCWHIKIAENPFAKGGMRLAYYGLIQYKGKWEKTVFKEYKRIGNSANTKEKYLELLECQTIADYLAQEFNKLLQITNQTITVKKIKFIMAKLVLEPLDAGKYRYMTTERFIEGSYKKFSNNAGFVNYDDPATMLQAFSHWTYEYTNGEMIVVDLQGIVIKDNQKYLLTDPCIHSTDFMRFGRSNFGKSGMKRFFQTHKCNTVCHDLQLKPHKHQVDIKATE